MPDRTKLTRAKIAALSPPKRGDRILYDSEFRNLGVRATAHGHKSYVLYRRVGGKPRRLLVTEVSENFTVDEVRTVTKWMSDGIDAGEPPADARRAALLAHELHKNPAHAMPEEVARRVAGLVVEAERDGLSDAEARTQALRINEMASEGLTLAEARRRLASEQEHTSRETMDAVFLRYMEQHAKPKKRTWRDDQRLYDYNLRKKYGHLAFDDIDVDLIRTIHGKVGQRSHVQANRVLAVLSRMFTFQRGKNAANPCRGIDRYPEIVRHRRLTAQELPRFIAAISQYEAETGDNTGADILRTLLLTGQRKGNVLAMRWAELDLDSASWTIPASLFKNKQPHTAALPADLITILQKRQQRYGRHKYVFPGRHGKNHRNDAWLTWIEVLKIAEIDRTTIRLHDIRATFATLMAENGETLEAIARQMGHRSYATTRRYMRMSQESVRSAVERTATAIRSM